MTWGRTLSKRVEKRKLLVNEIKRLIAKGDKAAEEHYKAAGLKLKMLKASYPAWADWEELLKAEVGITASRASELMQLADGRKTLEEVRANTAKRVRKQSGVFVT